MNPRATFTIIPILCTLITACAGTSSKTRSPDEYRHAIRSDLKISAYQETYSDDDVLVAESRLTFPDQTTDLSFITLTFEGLVDDKEPQCVFRIDDVGDQPIDIDPKKLVKPCDGTNTANFTIAGETVAIASHVETSELHLKTLHIDSISGPKSLTYYEGHAPNTDENTQNDGDR